MGYPPGDPWLPKTEDIRKKWDYIKRDEKKKLDKVRVKENQMKKKHAGGTGGSLGMSPQRDEDSDEYALRMEEDSDNLASQLQDKDALSDPIQLETNVHIKKRGGGISIKISVLIPRGQAPHVPLLVST